MDVLHPPLVVSAFMAAHLPEFLENYGISFSVDGPQLEYFVYQKGTGQDISCSLTLTFDAGTGTITILTFYPGLYLHPGTRYFSAVCFFLVLQHFARFQHIACDCRICLSTKKMTFDTFYALLQDFDFHVLLHGEEDRVAIESSFLVLDFDTSMFSQRPLVE